MLEKIKPYVVASSLALALTLGLYSYSHAEVGHKSTNQQRLEEKVDVEKTEEGIEKKVRGKPYASLRQLTFDEGPSLFPAWSPDGKKIAYMYAEPGEGCPQAWPNSIWIIDSDGHKKKQLTGEGYYPYFKWSPNSKKIAYVSIEEDIEQDGRSIGNYGIWVMNTDGHRKRKLATVNVDPHTIAWSPDGKKIAYVGGGINGENLNIWVMNDNGSNKEQLSMAKGRGILPAWSPDGKKIAYVTNNYKNKTSSVNVIDINEHTEKQLIVYWDNSANNPFPAWSPDGKKIAYVSGKSPYGTRVLSIIDSNGEDKRQLVEYNCVDYFNQAVWSPDGKKIAYVVSGAGDNIYSVDVDTNNITQLTTNESVSVFPAWSPDGNKITFVSNGGIWIMILKDK